MQDGMEDKDEEIDELGRASQAIFCPATALPVTLEIPYSPTAEQLHATLNNLTCQGQAIT
jgi:hypothetical protein